jgi:exodeoxyribonuclease VII large subunit
MRQQLVVAMDHYVKEYRYAVSLQERLLKDPTALLQNLRLRIDQLQISLMQFVKDLCTNRSQQLKALVRTLEANSPQYTITGKKNRLILLQKSIINSFQYITHLNLAKTNNAISLLSAVNPKAVLLRGYSIVYTEPGKQIVRSSLQVAPGDTLRIVTGAGTISSQVTETD